MLNDVKSLLALITVVFMFATILILFFVAIPPANLDLVKTFGIALISAASLVIGYYFGSSEGSARKTELMSPLAPVPGEAVSTSLQRIETTAEAGFIRLPLLIISLLICASLLISGCAGTTTAQGIQTGLHVADAATDYGMRLCKQGVLTPEECAAIAAGDLIVDVIEQATDQN